VTGSVSHVSGRVIVGVHGTPGSLQALRFAVGHARAFDTVLVPVITWEAPGGDSAYRPYPTYLTDRWAEAAEQRLLTAFDEGLGGPPTDVATLPLVIRGKPGRVLVEVADRENDVLVVGRNHHRRLHRAWYGSTATHCVAHARCAVLIVQPSELELELRRRRSATRILKPGSVA
jgi:nucleotide-binding universal stress UspA family protein